MRYEGSGCARRVTSIDQKSIFELREPGASFKSGFALNPIVHSTLRNQVDRSGSTDQLLGPGAAPVDRTSLGRYKRPRGHHSQARRARGIRGPHQPGERRTGVAAVERTDGIGGEGPLIMEGGAPAAHGGAALRSARDRSAPLSSDRTATSRARWGTDGER